MMRPPERKLPVREHPDEDERNHQDAGAKQQVLGQPTHGEDERREPDGKQDERWHVKPPAAALALIAHEHGARRGHDHTARQRHGKDGAPAKQRHHEARDHGPARRAKRDAGHAHGQEEAHPLARGALEHDVHHEREQDARARRLDDAGGSNRAQLGASRQPTSPTTRQAHAAPSRPRVEKRPERNVMQAVNIEATII